MNTNERGPGGSELSDGLGFTVGQVVRLRVNAWDPPSEDSPGGLYGARGDKLIVAAIHQGGCEFPVEVHHPEITDGRTFGVEASEIEPWPADH